MIKRIFLLIAVSISLYSMEKDKSEWDGGKYEKGSDFQFENAKKVLAQFKLSDYKVIVDAGCGSGRVTQYMAEQAPESIVSGFDISESQIEEAKKKLVNHPNLSFISKDIRDFILLHKANLITCFAVMAWVEQSEDALDAIKKNIAPEGILVGTWANKNTNHPLLRAFDAIEKEPMWNKPMKEMGFGKRWFPLDEKTLRTVLEAKFKTVSIEPKNLNRNFKNREEFTAFLRGMLGGFLDLTILNSTAQNVLLDHLVEKYLANCPEKEDKSITYSLEGFIFEAQEPRE
jgi:trans-aconitate methyltransferase